MPMSFSGQACPVRRQISKHVPDIRSEATRRPGVLEASEVAGRVADSKHDTGTADRLADVFGVCFKNQMLASPGIPESRRQTTSHGGHRRHAHPALLCPPRRAPGCRRCHDQSPTLRGHTSHPVHHRRISRGRPEKASETPLPRPRIARRIARTLETRKIGTSDIRVQNSCN